ncbi:MAG TPA: ribose 5-phosphate isomerase B [Chloroflexi bacterium]|nr:ribose 5-phosphate isomerase B [Chloroflexota bacterium]
MKIAVGSDHAGYGIKQAVIEAIEEAGHEAIDLGVNEPTRVDYPDYGLLVGEAILSGSADRGIALCGSGVGMCITVNKMRGIYGAICHDTYSAHQGVEHDDMNVLCLGGLIIGKELAKEIVKAFLGAQFFNSGNYLRRVHKFKAIENQYSVQTGSQEK